MINAYKINTIDRGDPILTKHIPKSVLDNTNRCKIRIHFVISSTDFLNFSDIDIKREDGISHNKPQNIFVL